MRHVYLPSPMGMAQAPRLPQEPAGEGRKPLVPSLACPLSDLLIIACESLDMPAALLWRPQETAPLVQAGSVQVLGLDTLAAAVGMLSDVLPCLVADVGHIQALVPQSPTQLFIAYRVAGVATLCFGSETGRWFGPQDMARLQTFARTFAALLRDQQADAVLPTREAIPALVPDIAGLEAAAEELRRLETTDPLTGLVNRATFTDLLQRASANPHSALILVDLDEFGAINEAFGYGMGDACLKRVAARVAANCRHADAVGRLGGDEFAILIGGATDRKALERVALRLLSKVRQPLRCKGQVFRLGASIGVAMSAPAQPGAQPPNLFSNASMALHSAKRGGRNNFRFFDEEMRSALTRRFNIMRDIARALEADELELFYQPKVRLRDGGHAGYEALLRWRHADGSIHLPAEFDDALNDAELSRKIGDFVVETAIEQARQWQLARLPFNHIAINLSSSQFREPDFAERLLAKMDAAGLRPHMLEVEVTEGVFLTQRAGIVQHALETLMQKGVRIALDDFGTGFASLTHLRRFPVHTIKIDRSFVSRLLSHEADHSIVQAIIFLARNLNLDVVAEGIERESERDFLRALGCDVGQGYLFGRPVSARETTLLMSEPAPLRRMAMAAPAGRSVVQLR